MQYKKLSIILIGMFVYYTVSVMGADQSEIAASRQRFILNGDPVELTALNVNGHNYVKIADVAELLNIGINYNASSQTISIDQSIPFSGVNMEKDPTESPKRENYETVKGIAIPKIELPKSKVGTAVVDWFGIIQYNNNIYFQSEYVTWPEAERQKFIQSFLGKHLGKASGIIYEDDLENKNELISSVQGDAYAVKGYDPNFRICIPYEYNDFIGFFENLNGITLEIGKDLYNDRMHLKDNYMDVMYLLHDDWNLELGHEILKPFIGLDKADYDDFIDALYRSDFVVYAFQDELMDLSNRYQEAHVFFKMKDGTSIELRLFENGYVGYQRRCGYGRITGDLPFVYMEGDIFNKIFQAALK